MGTVKQLVYVETEIRGSGLPSTQLVEFNVNEAIERYMKHTREQNPLVAKEIVQVILGLKVDDSIY